MSKRGAVFKTISPPARGYNAFNLTHEKKFTCDFGQLIPALFLECSPGDIFKMSVSILARFMPLVHPIFHEVTIDFHAFFVPTRIIYGNDKILDNENKMEQPNRWERFISRGKDGNDQTKLPTWKPIPGNSMKYKIWDYMGLPLLNGLTANPQNSSFLPIDFAKRCYNIVFQEFFRDENLQESWLAKLPRDSNGVVILPEGYGDEYALNEEILNRNWTKDYFTSARPWQQKGTSPSFPIAGDINLDWTGVNLLSGYATLAPQTTSNPANLPQMTGTTVLSDLSTAANPALGNLRTGANGGQTVRLYDGTKDMQSYLQPKPTVKVDELVLNADMNDLRAGIQIQKWLERNARGGTRYTELLRAHHKISPRDERLDRPEYIGGSKQPIIISEVLQTSETGSVSAQGNLAGHGISADVTRIGRYRAEEYGYIIGLMSIMPRPAYQNGINRIHLRRSPYDFYWQEFANLSEREILSAEIAYSGDDNKDAEVFGFQGQYDELRIMPDMVCSDMRDDFKEWHIGRIFDQNNPPQLNEQFIQVDSQTGGELNQLKRVFAVPSERGILVNFGNIITKLSQMPVNPEPGLMDHF